MFGLQRSQHAYLSHCIFRYSVAHIRDGNLFQCNSSVVVQIQSFEHQTVGPLSDFPQQFIILHFHCCDMPLPW
jgi:hypothetical protein